MRHFDIALIAAWTAVVIKFVRDGDALLAAINGITPGLLIAAFLVRVLKRRRPAA